MVLFNLKSKFQLWPLNFMRRNNFTLGSKDADDGEKWCVCVWAAKMEKQLTWVGRAARREWCRMGKGSGTGNEGRWHLRQVLLVIWHYQGPLRLLLRWPPSFSSCSFLQGSVKGLDSVVLWQKTQAEQSLHTCCFADCCDMCDAQLWYRNPMLWHCRCTEPRCIPALKLLISEGQTDVYAIPAE